MMENDRFIDLPSIRQHFPRSIALPERLIELLTLLHQKYRYYHCDEEPLLKGVFFDDYYIKNGNDLANHFGIFMLSSVGDRVGYWFYEDCSPDNAPIVIIHESGGLVLANSLEEFLERLIQDTFWDYCCRSDFETDPNNGWIDEVDIWLHEVVQIIPRTREELLFDPSKNHPDIWDWLDQKHIQQREKVAPWEEDLMHQIADVMSPYFPTESSLSDFEIQIAGSCFEMHRGCSQRMIKHAEALEPLIREFRERRSQTHPENKRWFVVYLILLSSGSVNVYGNFDDVPSFRQVKPTLQDYIDDLRLELHTNLWISRDLNLEVLRLSLVEDCHATFIQAYPHLVPFDPDDDQSWSQYGDLLFQFKHYEAAISAYNHVLVDDSNRQDIVDKREQAQQAIQHS
ncbi:hypothetical protein [Acaryochloris marina]|uniref:hypothetical protein n=1 Tax=Acaryochloris marina TaxID=155978 RepID=UPI001BAFDEE4|nr:hypothetical protein [Acaryochloris marina]QUY43361.1 hypothetical protein I1H34_04230 [Acaryochloris marina S15]